MASIRKAAGSIWMGLYSWILTLFTGMVILDVLYTRLVSRATGVFSSVSDFLLLVGFCALVAAVPAAAAAWKSRSARSFLAASFFLDLLEFIIPIVLAPLLVEAPAPAIGPWLRVAPPLGASILALAGLIRYLREGQTAAGI